jgi:hypothetical protein
MALGEGRLMAIRLLINTAPDPYTSQVAAAVLAALGHRPDNEEWMVSILSDQERGCIVSIDRPDGGNSRWQFVECGQDPIKDRIREELRREGYTWL